MMTAEGQRHQYANLDALRGVAAFAVVLYHAQSWFRTEALFAHGYMAVDFFFVLSGFVIAYAYEERLAKSGALPRFLLDRAIRLYPMILAGAAVGALAFLARASAKGASIGVAEIGAIAAAAIPWPVTWLTGDPWPVNPPIWSIFWELVVNLLFGLTVRWWTTRIVLSVVLLSLGLLSWCSLEMGGFMPMGPKADSWTLGGLRTLAGFGLGVLMLRAHRAGIGCGGPRWLPVAALLLSTTLLPQGASVARWLDPLLAAVVFPAIVLMAAGSSSLGLRFTRIGGALSYPLYAVHLPLMLIAAGGAARLGMDGTIWQPVAGIALIAFVVATAWGLYRWWDVPIRAWLKTTLR